MEPETALENSTWNVQNQKKGFWETNLSHYYYNPPRKHCLNKFLNDQSCLYIGWSKELKLENEWQNRLEPTNYLTLVLGNLNSRSTFPASSKLDWLMQVNMLCSKCLVNFQLAVIGCFNITASLGQGSAPLPSCLFISNRQVWVSLSFPALKPRMTSQHVQQLVFHSLQPASSFHSLIDFSFISQLVTSLSLLVFLFPSQHLKQGVLSS